MSRKWMSLLGLAVAALLLAPMSASAVPSYSRLEVAGVPQVVRVQSSTAFSHTQNSGRIAYHFDNERIYWSDHRSSGHSFFWLDPTATGNLGGSHESCTGSVRSYTVGAAVYAQTYAGTVTGDGGATDNRSPLNSGNVGMAYLPPEKTVVTKAGSGNYAPIHEIRAARSVGGVDVLGEGTLGDRTDTAQHRSSASPTLTTGSFHLGLAYLGEDATNYNFLFIDRQNSSSQNGWTMTLGKAWATAPTATTAGVRTLARTSGTVTSTQLNDLVPGVSDYVRALANDAAGNVYALSTTGGSNYVTAFSLAGGFNPLDLDPDDDNGVGSTYLDLTGLITNTAGDTNMDGHGLAVNADASLLYVAANADAANALHDNIFVFEKYAPPRPIPEPGALALTLLGIPFILGRRKRGRKMSRKWMSFLGLAVVALLLAPMAARAQLVLNYEGSFNLPSSAAWGDYYYHYATYVPDGNARPGSGVSVTGPSLVVWTQWAGNVREVNAFPTLAKLPADPIGTATLLTNANGGTETGGSPVTAVDSAGNLWTPQGANQWGPGMWSNPGTHVLGESAQPALSREAGWPSSSYLSHGGGVLRKGDGLGGDLFLDGTTAGAKFLTSSRIGADLGSGSQNYTAVMESTRIDSANMSSTPLFYAPHTGHRPMEYVRGLDGDEWFVLWLPGAHTGDSFTLDFFASASAGNTSTPTLPTEQIDIGPAIAAGAGWINAATYIRYVGVDWDNSQLYVLEGNGAYGAANPRDGRIHVFTVGEPPPPIAEPAGLGLLGLALLGIRKKRS